MEIEKKFLVKKVPQLDKLESHIISQSYLNIDSEPTLRIRKLDNNYYLTYKYNEKSEIVNKCIEHELPISKEAYYSLLKRTIGYEINKKRYVLSLDNNLKAEIDVFEGKLTGLVLVEVEFESEFSARNFIPPSWFGKEVTKNKKYRNSYLSQINDISKID